MSTLDKLQAALDQNMVQPWVADSHARHLADYSGPAAHGVEPLAVCYPRTTQDVSTIMAFAHAAGIAVVPQGGLTGLAGGALPTTGAIVLSLERMNIIEEIDRLGSLMVVEAGVSLQRIQEAADEAGLLFPLDLGARGSALIGGVISTNAGGNRVLRYGMARDLTLGIEVVLPDGTIVDAMNRMIKNNAGYDLKHLFIGSEGTLGIITRAVIRLHPRASTQNVALCAAHDYAKVLSLLDAARSHLGEALSAFEVMWDDFFGMAITGLHPGIAFAETPPFIVLIEASGRDVSEDKTRFENYIAAMFEDGVISDARIAQSGRDVEAFWSIRDASGELRQRFGPAINFDVSLPVQQIDDFARTCRDRILARVEGTRVLIFGHIADGNIHIACLDEDGSRKHAVERIVYDTVREWHGSISAEHGIGVEKRAFLGCSRSAAYLDLMQVLKRALDPRDLLNPGKVLPPRSPDAR